MCTNCNKYKYHTEHRKENLILNLKDLKHLHLDGHICHNELHIFSAPQSQKKVPELQIHCQEISQIELARMNQKRSTKIRIG